MPTTPTVNDFKKVIKLTQEQYNILAAGGTVGEYTGLNDDYLYYIKDFAGVNAVPIVELRDATPVESE